MKKILLLAFSLSIIACSEDDSENSPDPIIGKWQLVDFTSTMLGMQSSSDCIIDENGNYCPSLIEDEYTWTFSENGNYSNSLIFRSFNASVNENHTGTWERGVNPGESVEVIKFWRSTNESGNWESFEFELNNNNNSLVLKPGGLPMYDKFIFSRVY